MLTKGVIGNRAAEETEMTATFTRPGHLADIAAASPVGAIMGRMETAFINNDVVAVENGYTYFMMNMGAHGAVGAAEDNAIAEYLEQFDSLLCGEVA